MQTAVKPKKPRKQPVSGCFWAKRTYWRRIKDDHKIDPCCGSGGMFVQSAKFVENHSGNINNIAIYGEDSNPTTWKMAQMNLAMLTASLFFM
jgi:type I restriction-modification system DNA methylase subunit